MLYKNTQLGQKFASIVTSSAYPRFLANHYRRQLRFQGNCGDQGGECFGAARHRGEEEASARNSSSMLAVGILKEI